MPFLFYTSISQTIGMGHYYRLKALQSAMNHAPITWVLDKNSDSSLLNEPYISLEEALKINRPMIVDHRNPDARIYDHKKIAMIDDFGGNFPVDILINGNAFQTPPPYTLKPQTKAYIGPAYTLLRPEFGVNINSPQTKDLTIVIGSGPSAETFLNKLKKEVFPQLKNWHINLVVGKTLESSLENINNPTIDKSCNLNTKSLIAKLKESSIVLSTSGVIVYEALALGLPLIAYPYTKESLPEVLFLESQKALINLGENPSAQSIIQTLHTLHGDKKHQESLAQKGKSLVDGQGALRVANLILEHFS